MNSHTITFEMLRYGENDCINMVRWYILYTYIVTLLHATQMFRIQLSKAQIVLTAHISPQIHNLMWSHICSPLSIYRLNVRAYIVVQLVHWLNVTTIQRFVCVCVLWRCVSYNISQSLSQRWVNTHECQYIRIRARFVSAKMTVGMFVTWFSEFIMSLWVHH